MSPIVTLTIGLAALILYFAAFWVLQRAIGNSAVVDVGWAMSVGLVGMFYCAVGAGDISRRGLLAMLILSWATRLSLHLYRRWCQHPEDERYTALKEKWGDQAQFRMFRFYQLQAVGAFIFTWPLLVVANLNSPLGGLDSFAIVVWVISIVGEALSDLQLKWFKQKEANQGKVCRVGFWRYSRHPNYFFEWLHWWTYVLLAATSPWVLVTLLAPLAMWHFLVNVTGIPATEARAVQSRGDEYRQYQQTTNAFFPWFPKTQNVVAKK